MLMSIKEKITAEMKTAMKSGDAMRVSVLRMILAAAQNRELEKRSPLDDGEFLKLIVSISKQRAESIEMYKSGNRGDLVEKETLELAIVKSFLPEELSEGELVALIDSAIAETGAFGMKDLGKVMKAISLKVAGRADGKKVSELVRSKLS